jgi:hypothetical protein
MDSRMVQKHRETLWYDSTGSHFLSDTSLLYLTCNVTIEVVKQLARAYPIPLSKPLSPLQFT